MSTVNCHLLETVVLRDFGIALQVMNMEGAEAQVSVQPAVPSELGQRGWDSNAARRILRNEIRERTHAVADTLNQLHEQLETGQTATEVEATVCHIYRQLRDLDRSVNGWLADAPPSPAAQPPSDIAMASWLRPAQSGLAQSGLAQPGLAQSPPAAEATGAEHGAEFDI